MDAALINAISQGINESFALEYLRRNNGRNPQWKYPHVSLLAIADLYEEDANYPQASAWRTIGQKCFRPWNIKGVLSTTLQTYAWGWRLAGVSSCFLLTANLWYGLRGGKEIEILPPGFSWKCYRCPFEAFAALASVFAKES